MLYWIFFNLYYPNKAYNKVYTNKTEHIRKQKLSKTLFKLWLLKKFFKSVVFAHSHPSWSLFVDWLGLANQRGQRGVTQGKQRFEEASTCHHGGQQKTKQNKTKQKYIKPNNIHVKVTHAEKKQQLY